MLTVAEEIDEFINFFRVFERILRNNETNFIGKILKQLTKLYKIRHLFTFLHSPRLNDFIEKTLRSINEFLRHYINKKSK